MEPEVDQGVSPLLDEGQSSPPVHICGGRAVSSHGGTHQGLRYDTVRRRLQCPGELADVSQGEGGGTTDLRQGDLVDGAGQALTGIVLPRHEVEADLPGPGVHAGHYLAGAGDIHRLGGVDDLAVEAVDEDRSQVDRHLGAADGGLHLIEVAGDHPWRAEQSSHGAPAGQGGTGSWAGVEGEVVLNQGQCAAPTPTSLMDRVICEIWTPAVPAPALTYQPAVLRPWTTLTQEVRATGMDMD